MKTRKCDKLELNFSHPPEDNEKNSKRPVWSGHCFLGLYFCRPTASDLYYGTYNTIHRQSKETTLRSSDQKKSIDILYAYALVRKLLEGSSVRSVLSTECPRSQLWSGHVNASWACLFGRSTTSIFSKAAWSGHITASCGFRRFARPTTSDLQQHNPLAKTKKACNPPVSRKPAYKPLANKKPACDSLANKRSTSSSYTRDIIRGQKILELSPIRKFSPVTASWAFLFCRPTTSWPPPVG